MTRFFVLTLFLGLASARAQDTPTAPASPSSGWGAHAVHRVDVLRGDRPTWHDTRLVVQRRSPAGALGVEAARVERYDHADATLAVDAYRVLSRRAYANVRVEGAPGARVVPHLSVLAQVYAGVAPGWEATAGARYLVVPGADAALVSAGLARTRGPFVVGAQATLGVAPAATLSATASARYQPDPPARGPATRAALVVGQAQEAVVADDGAVQVRRQWVAALSGQRAVAGPLGVTTGASILADGPLSRWSVEAGLIVRW